MGHSRALARLPPKEVFAMAASPVGIVPSNVPTNVFGVRRRPLPLTSRRVAANRRNAALSTGPRTLEGKARVAKNAIKPGFFAGPERWNDQQRRDFAEILAGLRDDFKPQGESEERCVATIAESYVRTAAMMRYENIAALKYHQQSERELNERIASANASEAALLEAGREQLRSAGLWGPTIPGPREAAAIIRYESCLHRGIGRATSELEGLQKMRLGGSSRAAKVRKQTHRATSPSGSSEALRQTLMAALATENAKTNPLRASASSGPEAWRKTSNPTPVAGEIAKTKPLQPNPPETINAKTNPLSSTFTGNRHQRRRAKALAARCRSVI